MATYFCHQDKLSNWKRRKWRKKAIILCFGRKQVCANEGWRRISFRGHICGSERLTYTISWFAKWDNSRGDSELWKNHVAPNFYIRLIYLIRLCNKNSRNGPFSKSHAYDEVMASPSILGNFRSIQMPLYYTSIDEKFNVDFNSSFSYGYFEI